MAHHEDQGKSTEGTELQARVPVVQGISPGVCQLLSGARSSQVHDEALVAARRESRLIISTAAPAQTVRAQRVLSSLSGLGIEWWMLGAQTIVVDEGAGTECVFFVVSGSLEVVRRQSGGQQAVPSILESGTCFGFDELPPGLLDGAAASHTGPPPPPPARVKCITGVVLMAVSQLAPLVPSL